MYRTPRGTRSLVGAGMLISVSQIIIIAAKLGTASGTIKMHVQNILAKMGAPDRTRAVTLALERGILRLDP